MTYKNLKRLAGLRELVLGSGSPRRLELLKETGVKFKQMVPGIFEPEHSNGSPFEHARILAEQKALSISSDLNEKEIVIGADTVVVLNGKAMSKPIDNKEAYSFLRALSGKKHFVCSALAIADNKTVLTSGFETTGVYFNDVMDKQIEEYISTGEPLDKAGAYGIQGEGGFLVDRIEGNLDTVIGLPRQLLEQLAGEVCSKIE